MTVEMQISIKYVDSIYVDGAPESPPPPIPLKSGSGCMSLLQSFIKSPSIGIKGTVKQKFGPKPV